MLSNAAILTQAASSATGDYQAFSDIMDRWGYDWQAHKVHTEDKYILTTFHVLGNQQSASSSKGTVLIQHGDFQDGAYWMSHFTESKPFQLMLVDAGYDVWIGNCRGTRYSQEHETLDATLDNDYWMYTWADMGIYDDVANINMIKEQAQVDKVFYIGYSQGTLQMFYGLAHLESQFHADSVHKVVQLAPCFYPSTDPDCATVECTNNGIMRYQDEFGIYAYNGPHWTRDLQTLCDNFSEETCEHFTKDTGYPAASVQSEKHWTMNGVVKRFQEFDDKWMEGVYETPLVSLESIKHVPISLFTGTEDWTCPYHVALDHIPRISSQTKRIDVEGESHMYFCTANSPWFMENLINELQVPTISSIESHLFSQ